ncbi:MAG: SH3 domain-containing protein [Oscillospiraceae bacterium]|nr:SH3 domain-containing protein [Oscillospiraceae bacterium]
MSDRNAARRVQCEVAFEGVDITESIRPYLLRLTYTDNEEDETDDLELTLADREDIWLQKWLTDMVDAAAAGSGSSGTYTVTAASGLNVRSGAGAEYSRLGALSYGTSVTVSSIESGWAKITYNGQTAYVSADYLTAADGSGGSGDTGLTVSAAIAALSRDGDGRDRVLSCGAFELDSVTAAGPPRTVTVKCTSIPYGSALRQTKRSRAWCEFYLKQIAQEMAGRAGMALMFLCGTNPYYARAEQVAESDIAFLSTLCHNAGVSLKVTGGVLVLFDQADYEAQESVRTFRNGDGTYSSYTLETGEADAAYALCTVRYTNPLTGQTISGTAYAEDYDADSEDNQTLCITAKVDSIAEAQTLAAKQLRLKNKFARTARFTVPGDPYLVSGATVALDGWGAFDGQYIIKQAKHTVGGGYTTTVTCRRTLEGY